MEIGFYVKSAEQLKEVLVRGINPQWIMFGDYGCFKRIPELEELQQAAGGGDVKFHYISPKINMGVMDYEYRKVLSFLEQGLDVSINDLGLLYKLRPDMGKASPVYLGRLLTKSVNRWVWGDLHVAEEEEKAREYFAQNNFYQQEKMELFRNWNIKGIETTVFQKEENSLKKIKEQGFEIIGYMDQTIAAISRACPIVRDRKLAVKGRDCSSYCVNQEYEVTPANLQQKERYPKLMLEGAVLMRSMKPAVTWDGYEKAVFSALDAESAACIKEMVGRHDS